MPWKSTKQQAWGHTPAGIKALGGEAKVHEWDQATKRKPGGFAKLPKRAGDAPGADLSLRPAVRPAALGALKGFKPPAPAGIRTMSRKPASGLGRGLGRGFGNALAKPRGFGSMSLGMPSVNTFDGSEYNVES